MPNDDTPTKPQRRPAPVVVRAGDTPKRPPPFPTRYRQTPAGGTLAPLNDQRFTDSEAPTAPKGIEFEAALLARYYREMDPADRPTLLRNAEQWAARNRK